MTDKNTASDEFGIRNCKSNAGVTLPPMATLEIALEIAAAAHAGQTDKGGQPYCHFYQKKF